MCEIIQPYTTQCIARTIRKAKISCKTSMFKPSAQDFLTPFGTLQRYTTLFDSFTDFSFHFYATLNFFAIMVRLTDVQRGRAIALLMQGQRQQRCQSFWGQRLNNCTSCKTFKGDRSFSRPTAVWASTRDVATSRQDNPSGTFAESSSHCYRNCP